MKSESTNETRAAKTAFSPGARARWEESGLAKALLPHLLLVGRLVSRRLEMALVEAGLGMTPAQARAVATLWLHGPMTQQSLAIHTEVEPSTLVRTLDVMEREEIAVRDRNPDDRRSHLVHLTPEGEDLVPRLLALWEQVEADVLEGFEAEEIIRFRELVSRVISKLATGETLFCG